MSRTLFLAAICAGLMTLSVHAEPVLIRSGTEWGQGWVFHHESGCWVASASHVIKADSAVIVGPDQRQGTAAAPDIFRSPNLDMVLLRIQGPLADQCPSSLVGDVNIDPTLERINRQAGKLDVERRTGSETSKGVVAFGVGYVQATFSGKSDKELTFRMAPADIENNLSETDSGSPVLFVEPQSTMANVPIGIVTDIRYLGDKQVITVVRMDAVRRFLDQILPHAPRVQSVSSIGRKLKAISGGTVDSNCGPDNLLREGARCGWKAKREIASQPIAVIIDLGRSVANISAIQVRVAGDSAPAGFVVSTPIDEADAEAGERRCALSSGEHEVSCPVGIREARYVRVAVDDDQVELIGVEPLVSAPSLWPQQDSPETVAPPAAQPEQPKPKAPAAKKRANGK